LAAWTNLKNRKDFNRVLGETENNWGTILVKVSKSLNLRAEPSRIKLYRVPFPPPPPWGVSLLSAAAKLWTEEKDRKLIVTK